MSGIVESGTMEDKIRAFIILTSKSRKVETDKREMRGSVLVFDGTLERKTTPFKKMTDDLQHSNLFSRFVPSFLCFQPFLLLLHDFLGSPHLTLSHRSQLSLYFLSYSVLLFFIFPWGWYDAITGENVKTFPADEAVSIIASILHFSKEKPLLDHPLSYSISFRRLFVSPFGRIFQDNSRVYAAVVVPFPSTDALYESRCGPIDVN